MDDFATVDEAQFSQGQDAVFVQGGLEAEVEALEGLDAGQPGGQQARLDAPRLARGAFLAEHFLEQFQR